MCNQTKTTGKTSESTDFWYDPNGNQISSMTVLTGGADSSGIGIVPVGADNTSSYSEYDSWNQLTKTMQNGKTASYTYNGDGLRMSKTVDGKTTKHIWDGTDIVGDVTDGTVTKYIRGLQLISSKNGSNENFYTYNGHGDVVQLTNNTGAITKQYNYDAFGVETNKTNNDTNPFRYCGEYYDSETDSIYLRARYYRPTAGRFITEDPINDGLNWYVYGNNNSMMFEDPNGEDAVVILNSNGAPVSDYVSSYDGESKLGHMAIVVQDYYGNWYYFSISTEGITKIAAPSWALNDCNTFNYWLSSYWSDYDTATYVTADTAASYDYFNECYERNEKYNWAFNNCSEFVIKGLKEATLYDGTSMSSYLGFENGALPKSTMNTLSRKFYNNCWNYNSYRKVINDKFWEARNGKNKNKRDAKNLEKLYY